MEQIEPKKNNLPAPVEGAIDRFLTDDKEEKIYENIYGLAVDPEKRGKHTVEAARFLIEQKYGKSGRRDKGTVINVQISGYPKVEEGYAEVLPNTDEPSPERGEP
ncbi:MAG: hypothetical protein KGJ13_02095 [Patescibacteria group bacterium]|nr:hypothetical protein [Patescibacteria group bacterium]